MKHTLFAAFAAILLSTSAFAMEPVTVNGVNYTDDNPWSHSADAINDSPDVKYGFKGHKHEIIEIGTDVVKVKRTSTGGKVKTLTFPWTFTSTKSFVPTHPVHIANGAVAFDYVDIKVTKKNGKKIKATPIRVWLKRQIAKAQ